ncbi:PulJ/GspJ family protein [Jannaschia pohangensis]|nr:hypothetical protein [Jannaschia pohangensis]
MSLLETMIALAMMALIATALAGTLQLSLRSHDRSMILEEDGPAIARRVQLRRWLTQAAPQTLVTSLPKAFEGKSREMSFLTFASTPFAPDAAALRVTVVMNGGVLILRAEAIDDDGDVLETFDGPLAEDGGDAAFAYFDADAEPPAWRATWTADDGIPDLVRIEIPEGSRPRWPEFTVRPDLGG